MKTSRNNSFNSPGTEGMLDVILGCTLVFLLLTALARIDGSSTNEFALPDIDLTPGRQAAAGAARTRRTVISLKGNRHETAVWIDDREVTFDQLDAELLKLGRGAHVALRRDRELPCRIEDQVILACRRAGIERVAITVQQEEPSP